MSLPLFAYHPSGSFEDAITRASAENRVDREYWDIFHHRHEASSEVQKRILTALGWNTTDRESIEAARRDNFRQRWTAMVPAMNVLEEQDRSLTLTFPSGKSGKADVTVALEGGNRVEFSFEVTELAAVHEVEIGDERWTARRVPLPSEVPLGYHEVQVSFGNGESSTGFLVLCPQRAFLPASLESGGKMAGFNVTLYGLRSDRNWGCGDFTDLQRLCDWVRSVGFSFVGLNPLHALHNRAPYNTSPYLPLSIFYKNLIYLDIERIAEAGHSSCFHKLFGSPAIQSKLQALRDSETVQYSEVDRLKRRFLKVLYREFRLHRKNRPERASAFAAFCEREGDLLHNFALYCALDEILHKQDRNRWTWQQWPAEYHSPDSRAVRNFAQQYRRTVEFYKYVQFALEEQLDAAQAYAKQAGLPVGLYHDLALATDSCGADLWAYRDFYVGGCRVGSPPDDFSPSGQDWAFPPPNSDAHRKSGYRLYRESIRKIVLHGGALRIDHVMRLFRLFWIPDGATPADGTYVRDYAEELMRILALESVRSQNIIIGEDLGTVTDEIRDMLARFRILSYRLFPFEKRNDKTYKQPSEYPGQALVASSTHDLATLCGFWVNRDVEARKTAGLADDSGYWGQIRDRKQEKQNMLNILHAEGLLPHWYERDADRVPEVDGPLHNAIVGFLARVPSMILLLNQEDLTKELNQQNLPGSTSEYPNWQRKMQVKLEELTSDAWKPFCEMFSAQLKNSGRHADLLS
jgi:4-alpha-glucanotransferase